MDPRGWHGASVSPESALAFWRLRRLRTDGYLAPLCDVHDDVQQLVRARAEIRYVSSGQPVTFGFRRPVVLLPEILRSQSADIRRVVLCHELFHVRRHDWAWVVAEEVVKSGVLVSSGGAVARSRACGWRARKSWTS